MRITQTHVRYWRDAKAWPSWARARESALRMGHPHYPATGHLDRCINEHAGPVERDRLLESLLRCAQTSTSPAHVYLFNIAVQVFDNRRFWARRILRRWHPSFADYIYSDKGRPT